MIGVGLKVGIVQVSNLRSGSSLACDFIFVLCEDLSILECDKCPLCRLLSHERFIIIF